MTNEMCKDTPPTEMMNGNGLQRIKSDPNLNKHASIAAPRAMKTVDYDMIDSSNVAVSVPPADWKKFATYSANSLRSLSNGLMIDQNGTFYQKDMLAGAGASSTPTKHQQTATSTTPTKTRPTITDSVDYFNGTVDSAASYTSPSRARSSHCATFKKTADEVPSLLKTISSDVMAPLEADMGEMKISGAALLAKQHLLKQELNAKLNDVNKMRMDSSLDTSVIKNYDEAK